MKQHFIKIVAIGILLAAPLGVSLAQSDIVNTVDYQQLSDNLSHKTTLNSLKQNRKGVCWLQMGIE